MGASWWTAGWIYVRVGRDVHVVPPRDLKPHKKSRRCPCSPKVQDAAEAECAVDEDCPLVVVHTAYDGRE